MAFHYLVRQVPFSMGIYCSKAPLTGAKEQRKAEELGRKNEEHIFGNLK
jgi:hypothetical protein